MLSNKSSRVKRSLIGLGLLALAMVTVSGNGWAEQIQAGVSKRWTVDMARREAFREAKPFVDVSRYPSIDPNFMENLAVRHKGGGKVGRRSVTVFSDGIYSVIEDGSNEGYYYLSNGKLGAIQFEVGDDYPAKSYKHAAFENPGHWRKGELISVSLWVDAHNQYGFNPDGTLNVHWVNDKCYEVDGSSCGTRKTFVY